MSKEDRIEIEKISNQLFELKYWLSEQPGHPTHLSNLPQWFWESWGEYIDDLKRLSRTNNQYGIDAEKELTKIFYEEMNESKEDFYKRIKKTLNIESFMNATDNNLDMLFKYMFSATDGIRLSNFTVAEFIKDEYGDDFYLRREQLKMEEHQR